MCITYCKRAKLLILNLRGTFRFLGALNWGFRSTDGLNIGSYGFDHKMRVPLRHTTALKKLDLGGVVWNELGGLGLCKLILHLGSVRVYRKHLLGERLIVMYRCWHVV